MSIFRELKMTLMQLETLWLEQQMKINIIWGHRQQNYYTKLLLKDKNSCNVKCRCKNSSMMLQLPLSHFMHLFMPTVLLPSTSHKDFFQQSWQDKRLILQTSNFQHQDKQFTKGPLDSKLSHKYQCLKLKLPKIVGHAHY